MFYGVRLTLLRRPADDRGELVGPVDAPYAARRNLAARNLDRRRPDGASITNTNMVVSAVFTAPEDAIRVLEASKSPGCTRQMNVRPILALRRGGGCLVYWPLRVHVHDDEVVLLCRARGHRLLRRVDLLVHNLPGEGQADVMAKGRGCGA